MSAKKSLWQEVYKTDPTHTKGYKGAGGFSGTAVASLYPVQRATEVFGPMGDGWGLDIVTDEFIIGAPVINKETNEVICHEQTHSMRVRCWAKHEGQTLETIGIGLTPHITTNKYGVTTDHEAQKKTLTDAIKNALTRWGFSADVYMGLHDDKEYVQYMLSKAALEKADDRDAEEIKQREDYEAWKTTNIELIATSPTIYELERLYKSAVRKANLRKDDDYVKRVTTETNARKIALKEAATETPE